VVPSSFADYFLAMAGAGAALLGLLFVAVSVAPERTFGRAASVEHEAVASSAFTALANAFFVSAAALLPGASIGPVALVLSVAGLFSTAYLAARTVPAGFRRTRSIRRGRRLVSLLVTLLGSVAVYGAELRTAFGLASDPTDPGLVSGLARLVLFVYGLALVRAWELLGAPRFGLGGWLNPLGDPDEQEQTRARPSGARTSATRLAARRSLSAARTGRSAQARDRPRPVVDGLRRAEPAHDER
jgi:hypothetical protein